MKNIDKSRELIFEGILMHLKGYSLKETYDFYEKKYQEFNINEKDKSLIKYLTLAAIRNRGIIENIMNRYLENPLKKRLLEPKSGIMLGITQIFFSRIPTYASVNTVVELYYGKRRIWRSLVNALLRKVSNEKKILDKISNNILLNVPNWLKNSWKQQFGKDNTNKIIKAIFQEPPLDINVKNNPEVWKKTLNAKYLVNNTLRIKNKGNIKKLEGYKEGKWWIQDLAAQLPVKIMGEIKGKKIIEFCAAPGGKTAQMLNAGAFVTAVEISKKRAEMLKNNIERLRLSKNIKVICEDARNFITSERFGITILDVPCSSTGTIRKNPDVMWHKKKKDILEIKKLQTELLKAAIHITSTNGIIIYCNCSLQFEEGEKVIEYFLERKFVKLCKISENEIKGYPSDIIHKGLIRTKPYMYSKTGGMDGFFIARLKKL